MHDVQQKTLHLLKTGQLKGQKELTLTCGLTKFPEEILALADSLEFLNLSDNFLSCLPAGFRQLKKLRIVFFNDNRFTEFPEVLASCPSLSMVSFKNNRIATVSEQAFSPTIRWLILTNNRIKQLPAAIGKLTNLQKCMLAGNQLEILPEELMNCQNIELIRLSANRLQQFPHQLLELPRLSWLAYSGNPFCSANASLENSLPTIQSKDIEKGELLGEGASVERVETRAFGCLLEDLLERTVKDELDDVLFVELRRVQQDCMKPISFQRPLFDEIVQVLANLNVTITRKVDANLRPFGKIAKKYSL